MENVVELYVINVILSLKHFIRLHFAYVTRRNDRTIGCLKVIRLNGRVCLGLLTTTNPTLAAVFQVSRSLPVPLPFLANVNSRSRSLYAIDRPSVCRLSVVCLSVTLVHPTQAVQIFRNISTALGTLAIR